MCRSVTGTAESIPTKFCASTPWGDLVIYLTWHRNWLSGFGGVGVRKWASPIDWHDRSQTVCTERQTATLEVWGGRGNQTPTASPEATAVGWWSGGRQPPAKNKDIASRSHIWPTCVLAQIWRETHTHTHPFNGPLSGTTQVSQYQKGKTNLDLTEARDSEWQWHQRGQMQICTSLQTNNHASTPPLSFFQAGCPSCRPTNSVKALKACLQYD